MTKTFIEQLHQHRFTVAAKMSTKPVRKGQNDTAGLTSLIVALELTEDTDSIIAIGASP